MTPKGVYVGAGGEAGKWMIGAIARSLAMPIRAALGSQTFTGVLAKAAKADLAIVSELMAAGKVTPVIDRCYGLSEVPAAIAYLEEGHARGKVIVSLG
jgi:NADPH:quinone reductase-like Zn-dependent oxidoreductase